MKRENKVEKLEERNNALYNSKGTRIARLLLTTFYGKSTRVDRPSFLPVFNVAYERKRQVRGKCRRDHSTSTTDLS